MSNFKNENHAAKGGYKSDDYIAKTISKYLLEATESNYKKKCFDYEKILHEKEDESKKREQELRDQIDSLYERIKAIQEDQIEDSNDEIKYLKEIRRLEEEVNSLRINNNSENSNSVIEHLTNANKKYESDIEKLESTEKELREQIESLCGQLNSMQEIQDKKNDSVVNFQEEITRLENELKEANEKISAVNKEEAKVMSNEELEKLLIENERYEESVKNLNTKITEIEKEREILKSEYEKLQAAFIEYKENSGNASREEVENYRFLAYNDRKLGVKNKNAFNEAIRNVDQNFMTFIMINISDMRKINEIRRIDGDKKVKEVASKIKIAFENKGEVYRLLGDEFGILTTLNKEDSEVVLKDVLNDLSNSNSKFAYGISEGKEHSNISKWIGSAEASLAGMKRFNKLPIEEQQRRLDVQKNASPKAVIVEESESKLQKVVFDENDDEEFAEEIVG